MNKAKKMAVESNYIPMAFMRGITKIEREMEEAELFIKIKP